MLTSSRESVATLVKEPVGGLNDTTSDSRITAQLETKHPRRATEIDVDLSRYGPIGNIAIDLTQTFRSLSRRSGMGLDGLRNEHLRALACSFPGRKTAKVMECVNRFAELVLNNAMPAWYYWVATSVRLLAMIKPGAVRTSGAPDVRSLALGCVLLRAIESYRAARR